MPMCISSGFILRFQNYHNLSSIRLCFNETFRLSGVSAGFSHCLLPSSKPLQLITSYFRSFMWHWASSFWLWFSMIWNSLCRKNRCSCFPICRSRWCGFSVSCFGKILQTCWSGMFWNIHSNATMVEKNSAPLSCHLTAYFCLYCNRCYSCLENHKTVPDQKSCLRGTASGNNFILCRNKNHLIYARFYGCTWSAVRHVS